MAPDPPDRSRDVTTPDPVDIAGASGGPDVVPDTTGGSRRLNGWAVIGMSIVGGLLVLVSCTVLLRTYVVQSFFIPSPSMAPTLPVGDRIVVDKLSYDLHSVHRGDIVVFKRPPLERQDYPDLVKRVIGLPGETISSQNGHVYLDGRQLTEPWLPPTPSSYTGALPGDQHPQFNLPGPVTIPAGQYFVLGDNRTDSEDGRYFGPIPGSLIVGRVVAVIWPLSQAKRL